MYSSKRKAGRKTKKKNKQSSLFLYNQTRLSVFGVFCVSHIMHFTLHVDSYLECYNDHTKYNLMVVVPLNCLHFYICVFAQVFILTNVCCPAWSVLKLHMLGAKLEATSQHGKLDQTLTSSFLCHVMKNKATDGHFFPNLGKIPKKSCNHWK